MSAAEDQTATQSAGVSEKESAHDERVLSFHTFQKL